MTDSSESNNQNLRVKKGDYTVHVFLEEARGLSNKGDDTLNVVVKIHTFDEDKYSSILHDVSPGAIVSFNEHFFFDKNNVTVEQFESTNILIECRNHKMILKNSLVGNYEMDLTYVYKQKDHCIRHQWIALSNPGAKGFSKLRGYVKVGISVTHEFDTPADLTLVTKDNTDVILPPQIVPQTSQLIITLLKAESLPVMDTGGTLDAYIEAHFAGCTVMTSVKSADEATMSAYWNEELFIPVMEPCVAQKLLLKLWDKDMMAINNDLVGSFNFDWDEILDGKYTELFWANIYGAPPGISNEQTAIMNNISERASHWRGRVLLKLEVERNVKQAVETIELVKDPEIEVYVRDTFEIGEMYELRAQVYRGHAFPKNEGKYSIAVSWCNLTIETSEIITKNGCVDWYENLKRKVTLVPYKGDVSLPDIFIYLKGDNEKISYIRYKVQPCMNLKDQPKWFKLYPDNAVGKIQNNWQGGFVKLRVYVGKYDSHKDTIKDENWSIKPIQQPASRKVLLCHLFQCRNLPAADNTGLSDPYVQFYYVGNTVSTGKTEKLGTLNPMWYKTLRLDIEMPEAESSPPIIVHVWDFDSITTDDFIGTVIIDMIDAEFNPPLVPRPKWYKLTTGRSSDLMGEILLSFTVHNPGDVPDYNIVPESIPVIVEINVLGLRDLKPAVGFLPVTKPFIKFDVNSLVFPGDAKSKRDYSTQPLERGSNPNINAVIQFETKVPIDPLYCPSLTCSVMDYMLMGLSTPLIGTFSINLSNFLNKKKNDYKCLIKHSNVLAHHLTNKILPENTTKIHEESILEVTELEESELEETKLEETKIKEIKLEETKLPKTENLFFVPSLLSQTLMKMKSSVLELEGISVNDARSGKVVIYPQFVEDKELKRMIEVDTPDENYFMPIGYTRVHGDNRLHYRFYFKTELEDSGLIEISPFHFFNLIKGRSTKITGSDAPQVLETTGKFKGLIRILPNDKVAARKARQKMLILQRKRMSYMYKKTGMAIPDINFGTRDEIEIDVDEEEANQEFDEIARQLLVKSNVLVRLYIIDAFDLAALDVGSMSDPYLEIKLGDKVIDEKDNYQQDTCNPKFYKRFDLNASLPGESILKISLWDKDDLFSDDKIGTTIIDLEDRFFSTKWKKVPHKPIETRKLFHKSTRHPRGYIRLWLDIFSEGDVKEPIDISPRPPVECEARLIIWRSEGIPNFDTEGVSDLYVKARVNNAEHKETDTHYRCQSGAGSWNWRLKFPVSLPFPHNVVNIQIWDKDIFSSNDYIADAVIEFDDIAHVAYEHEIRVKKTNKKNIRDKNRKDRDDKFWIDLKKYNDNREPINSGKLQVSFELVPLENAKACQVGEGRDQPNSDPYLPPPIGRFEWSWNPFKLISQTCGPEFKLKICLISCVIMCCLMIIFMIPMVASDFIAKMSSRITE